MIQSLKAQFFAYPLDFCSHFFLLLPVAFAGYRRKFLTVPLLVISTYFIVRFLEELVFLYYALLVKNNHSEINGAIILDILIVGQFYYLSFTSHMFSRRITVWITVLGFLVALVNFVTDGPTSVSWPTLRLIMIILSLTYFNRILSENRVRKILLHTSFWISAGFLFYGMGTFMTSIFSVYLTEASKETYDLFSNMDQLLSVLFSILVATGLWVSKFDKENYIQFA
ncbi:hypothetical protein JYG30_16520 [Fibrella sp. USSR17]